MYIELANMTLEEVSKITQVLTCARLGSYLRRMGEHTYLHTFDENEADLRGLYENVFTEV
ncbi:MAG: hypothetical protein V1728_03035 [Candidatus Micrarchaeota archaeon]